MGLLLHVLSETASARSGKHKHTYICRMHMQYICNTYAEDKSGLRFIFQKINVKPSKLPFHSHKPNVATPNSKASDSPYVGGGV